MKQLLEKLCFEFLHAFNFSCIWSKEASSWLYIFVMSRPRLRVIPHSIVAWMSMNSLLKAGVKSEV